MPDILQAQTDAENNEIVQKYKDMGGFHALVVSADGATGGGGGGEAAGAELLSLGGALYTTNWTTVLEAAPGEKLEIVYIKVANKRPRDIAAFSRWHDSSQEGAAPYVQEGPAWISEGDVEFLGIGQILEEGDKFDLRNEPADSVDLTVVYRKLV